MTPNPALDVAMAVDKDLKDLRQLVGTLAGRLRTAYEGLDVQSQAITELRERVAALEERAVHEAGGCTGTGKCDPHG